MTPTEATEAIAEVLQDHPIQDGGNGCGCGEWRAWNKDGSSRGCYEEHVAGLVVGVLTTNGWALVKLPESDRGWGKHPAFTVDESYLVAASPTDIFVEDDDSVTAFPPATVVKLAAALLAAAAAVSPTQKEPGQ